MEIWIRVASIGGTICLYDLECREWVIICQAKNKYFFIFIVDRVGGLVVKGSANKKGGWE
jgi:hypothetical protein